MDQSTSLQSNIARRKLRVDATANRRRILEAAQVVYAERGIDAPLDVIAQRAGVGNATLYRRFPTRSALLAAVFEERVAEYIHAAEEALRESDPWTGFCHYMERMCEMQTANRGTADLLTITFPDAPGLETQKAQALSAFAELVRRAQATGQLRADFALDDFILLLMANAGVVSGTGDLASGALKRFVGFVLDGCRTEGAHPLSAPLRPTELYDAMRQRHVSP